MRKKKETRKVDIDDMIEEACITALVFIAIVTVMLMLFATVMICISYPVCIPFGLLAGVGAWKIRKAMNDE